MNVLEWSSPPSWLTRVCSQQGRRQYYSWFTIGLLFKGTVRQELNSIVYFFYTFQMIHIMVIRKSIFMARKYIYVISRELWNAHCSHCRFITISSFTLPLAKTRECEFFISVWGVVYIGKLIKSQPINRWYIVTQSTWYFFRYLFCSRH